MGINEIISNLTLEQRVGQLFVAGFAGTRLTDEDASHIRKYHIGNIIYFTRNLSNKDQIIELSRQVQNVMGSMPSGIPAFIAVDQEGGMVTRIYNGATFFPSAMAIGKTSTPQDAYTVGAYMGQELRGLGINLNLAPVLDVNNNIGNPVIGVRSYGEDPKLVADFGTQFIKGLQANAVLACAKHFPGHGDTSTDSHSALPIIKHSISRLEGVELIPFKRAIETGVAAVMSSHILFENITSDGLPGTLSYDILTGLMRKRLGFDGLIITDCMEMDAIAATVGTERGALMAIKAGADLVCVSHARDKQAKAIELVLEAIASGEITEERINASVERILKAKASFKLSEYEHHLGTVSDNEYEDHASFSEQLSRNAVRFIKGGFVMDGRRTLIISTSAVSFNDADGKLNVNSLASIIGSRFGLDSHVISHKPTDEEIDEVIQKASQYEHIIIATYNAAIFTEQVRLVNRLLEVDGELLMIATRIPYDINLIPNVKHFVALYEYTAQSVRALSELLSTGCTPQH